MIRTASTITRWLTAAAAVLALTRVIARVAAPSALGAAASPTPAVDKEHIELYYKARDDIKEQIASADARATTILTIELALAAALIAAAPIIGGVLAKVGGAVRSLLNSGQFLGVAGAVIEGTLAFLFTLWFVLATIGAFLDTARVLNSDFRDADLLTNRRDLLRLLLHPGRLFPTSQPEMDRLGQALPFSPFKIVAVGTPTGPSAAGADPADPAVQERIRALTVAALQDKMHNLPVSDALLGDLFARARIARDKRLALHDATRAFSIQLLTVIVISFVFIALLAQAT